MPRRKKTTTTADECLQAEDKKERKKIMSCKRLQYHQRNFYSFSSNMRICLLNSRNQSLNKRTLVNVQRWIISKAMSKICKRCSHRLALKYSLSPRAERKRIVEIEREMCQMIVFQTADLHDESIDDEVKEHRRKFVPSSIIKFALFLLD